jgi:hypothetical protein
MPETLAPPYKDLRGGFDLYYKLTNVQVVNEKARKSFRPAPIMTERRKDLDGVKSAALPFTLRRGSALPRQGSFKKKGDAFNLATALELNTPTIAES